MGQTYMNEQDSPNKRLGEVYATIDGVRSCMCMVKDFEATANIKSYDDKCIGKAISGKKPGSITVKLSMTIYKCTEIFDDVIEAFKNTGLMPTIDVQATNNDPASCCGASTKIYRNCVIDGDVLLNAIAQDDGNVEQKIEMYASDYDSASKFKNPSYM